MKFGEIRELLVGQNGDLTEIKVAVKETNGKVAKAALDIAENKLEAEKEFLRIKGSINSNWRAIQVGTAIVCFAVIPLCSVIYYNLQKNLINLQSRVNTLTQKQ